MTGCTDKVPHKESPILSSDTEYRDLSPSWSRDYVDQYPKMNTTANFHNCGNLNVYVVGDVGNPNASVIRVVHISDTRGTSESLVDRLPNGHILIHSGDFTAGPPVRTAPKLHHHKTGTKLKIVSKSGTSETDVFNNFEAKVGVINDFFQRQPHPFKIFISGCWDHFTNSSGKRPTAREIQSLLPSAIYLEDSWCKVFGLKIYGLPWTAADELRPEDGTSSFNLGASPHSFRNIFRCLSNHHRRCQIPSFCPSCLSNLNSNNGVSTRSDTHCASRSWSEDSSFPKSDGFIFPDIMAVASQYNHVPEDTDILISHMPAWRPEIYPKVIGRIKPLLHLFGHDFSGYGVTWRHGVVFSNAALQLTPSYPKVLPQQRKQSSLCIHDPSGSASRKTGTTSSEVAHGLSVNPFLQSTHDHRDRHFYQHRPRRWRRRMSHLTSRFLFMLTRPFRRSPCSSFRSSSHHFNVPHIKQTPSSIASQDVAFQISACDEPFIYEPTVSVAGINNVCLTEYSRRYPLVFDVYVVIDDDQITLPDYLYNDD